MPELFKESFYLPDNEALVRTLMYTGLARVGEVPAEGERVARTIAELMRDSSARARIEKDTSDFGRPRSTIFRQGLQITNERHYQDLSDGKGCHLVGAARACRAQGFRDIGRTVSAVIVNTNTHGEPVWASITPEGLHLGAKMEGEFIVGRTRKQAACKQLKSSVFIRDTFGGDKDVTRAHVKFEVDLDDSAWEASVRMTDLSSQGAYAFRMFWPA